MMLSNKLMGGVTAGEDAAEGVDFDGVNDYLSRSTDLVGNIDSKTFTFSCWVYFVTPFDSTPTILIIGVTPIGAYFQLDSAGLITIGVQDAGGSLYSQLTSTLGVSSFGWNHILVSYDVANTNNARLYVNDILFGHSITKNDSTFYVDFTKSTMEIGNGLSTTTNYRGRLSHVFLDYTYRDLSIEANRRLFITADGKPTTTATLKALNPILYLPMKDAATAHINEGTGGNFTLNGVIARSGRGPNQFNAPYSYFDGTADYLSRTAALSGITGSKTFTLSFTFNADAGFISGDRILTFRDLSDLQIFQVTNQSGKLRIVADGTPNTADALVVDAFTIVAGRNYTVQISVDLVDTSKRHVYVNGESFAATWSVYGNIAIAFASASRVAVASNLAASAATLFSGNLGELYFDTKYIDLSNPDNLAKFVTGTGIDAKPADLGANGELPFGTPPLIYLPMYGDNAGKNYGTGGDFTVNSGPYTGARGPNEFWENKADFDGSTGYLARTSALVGVSDSKTFSCSFWFQLDTNLNNTFFLNIGTSAPDYRLRIERNSSTGQLMLYASNAAGTLILNATGSTNLSTGTGYYIQICIDQADVNKCKVYVNGVLESATWTTVTNDTIDIDLPIVNISAFWNGSTWGNFMDGKLSEFYFTTTYIDFSQEANRLKFRDAFGNPVALLPQIEAGTLPNPAIYMRFDPANFGKNLGTGGGFTINGTITDGGQL